jgi:septal ring factor EnvC (AmiA/AmiB activator)
MTFLRRTVLIHIAAATVAVALLLALAALRPERSGASTSSLGTLNGQLGHEQSRQQSLSSSIASLGHLISALDSQIQLVQSREAAVRDELAADQAKLASVQAQLARERKLLAKLRRLLAKARTQLSAQLVSGYESDRPDLVSVVLNAHGFSDLLNQVAFLGQAEKQQQSIISVTRQAKAQADRAARDLAKLQATDKKITADTALRAKALAGMDALLSSKEGALRQARSTQQAALNASRTRGRHLQAEINRIQAQQAAAERAAQQATAPSSSAALGPSGGWVIPYAIVLCESGGQNVPPNSAGASGYYQIIPSTWQLFGGSGPAAYLASKAEQDAVAARIWNGGAGASNWVCAGIVGIH